MAALPDPLAYPLAGLVVVALEQAVAAPFATGRLADAGATVIKVERPEGDFARGYDQAANGQSSYFVWLNRGKRSVAIDLATPEGKAELGRLIAGADVFVQNLRPGAAARLGFDPAELCRRDPRLIACSITGYDGVGAFAGRKAYDLLIQAESGLSSITGGSQEPARVGISVVDIGTGATAHAAILEALIGRGINGRGADIRISMFDVMADWLTVPLLNHEAGKGPKRIGLAHPSIAPYGVFKTADGRDILLAVQSDREWVVLCTEVLNAPQAARDPATSTNVARVENRALTDRLVGAALAALGCDEAERLLGENDIAFAFVNDMEGLSRHRELKRIALMTPGGRVSVPRPGPVVAGAPRDYGSVPAIGETPTRQRETP